MKRNVIRIGMALTIGLGVLLTSLSFLGLISMRSPVVQAADLTVCTVGPPTCAFTSIQAAVDAASDGDVVKVAAGTYTGNGNRDIYIDSLSIVIIGEGGYENTIIDVVETLKRVPIFRELKRSEIREFERIIHHRS